MASEEATMICARVHGDHAVTMVVRGSTKQWCVFCAEEIWVSPEGVKFAKENPGIKPTCVECAIGLMVEDGTEDFEAISVPGSQLTPQQVRYAIAAMQQEVREERERRG